jgi:DNA-binding LytR/AlgR family response regulator
MAHEICIAIVEDELLIAENIKMTLEDIGYRTCEPVCNYDTALQTIRQHKPDLVLLDINLGGEKDGIDIARQINEQYHLPFIFLTANSDRVTIERAKEVKPNAYLVKPFTQEELFAAIEIAVNNFNTSWQALSPKKSANQQNAFFIRENHRYLKIFFHDIAYLESRENYVVIHTVDKKSIICRSTFSEFLTQLPAEAFFRIHRSYAIRTELIEHIEHSGVALAGTTLPLSNTYKESLFEYLNIKP